MCKRFAKIIRLWLPTRCVVALLITAGVLFTSPSILRAQGTNISEKPKSGMALPGEQCRVHPLDEWTEPEKWAWKQICEGRNADFNKRPGNEALDPRNPKHDKKWANGRRKLSSSFLKTILLHEPFRSAIPYRGVRIIGVYFEYNIDLRDASIERLLALHHSLFKSPVIMHRFTTTRSISFVGSKFEDTLNMDSASVGGSLFMWNAQFKDVDLRGLKVGAQLSMNGSTFAGKLTFASVSVGSSLFMREAQFKEVDLRSSKVGDQLSMNGSTFACKLTIASATVGSSLFMQGAQFKEVDLRSSKVGDQLSMVDSRFADKFNMNSATIGSSLFMRETQFKEVDLRGLKVGEQLSMNGSKFEGKLTIASATIGSSLFMRETQFKEVDLRSSKVGAQLDMDGSKFEGKLHMNAASIGISLFMRNVTFEKPVDFLFLHVGSNFDARGATLSGLDLSGARIEGELRLGLGKRAKKTEWKGFSPKFTLRNASVGALQDTEDSWPDNLEREFEVLYISVSADSPQVNKKRLMSERVNGLSIGLRRTKHIRLGPICT